MTGPRFDNDLQGEKFDIGKRGGGKRGKEDFLIPLMDGKAGRDRKVFIVSLGEARGIRKKE